MSRHDLQSVTGNKVPAFSNRMATELRRLADKLESGDGFVVLAFMSCDYDSEGGPFVLVDRDAATVELVDEMIESMKAALIEGLE
jgi:hypothetical protein